MSEASRAAALAHAAAVHHGSGDAAATLETADAFHSFIAGDAATTAAPAAKAAKPAAAKPAVPAKKKVATPPPEDDAPDAEEEASEGEEGEVSKADAGAAIEALLNANLRTHAIKIFAKYKAKSMSGVKAEDYAALKQDAEDALMANS